MLEMFRADALTMYLSWLCRFLVVCTYQPDTLTVRASFSVPGRGGVVGSGSAVSPSDWDTDRNARNRKFKMVGKSALVLKEDYSDDFPSEEQSDKDTGRSDLLQVDEYVSGVKVNGTIKGSKQLADNLVISETDGRTNFRDAKYARLVNEKQNINENYRMDSGKSMTHSTSSRD